MCIFVEKKKFSVLRLHKARQGHALKSTVTRTSSRYLIELELPHRTSAGYNALLSSHEYWASK